LYSCCGFGRGGKGEGGIEKGKSVKIAAGKVGEDLWGKEEVRGCLLPPLKLDWENLKFCMPNRGGGSWLVGRKIESGHTKVPKWKKTSGRSDRRRGDGHSPAGFIRFRRCHE
jgi:hypothetical protein